MREIGPRPWVSLVVSTQRDGAAVRLLLRGQVCLLTVPELIGQIALAVDDRNPTVIIDLSGVTSMDRCGARFLGRAASPGLSGCQIVLRNASPAARDALAVIGLPA
jgi:anti-anti-sigma regulatory factor